MKLVSGIPQTAAIAAPNGAGTFLSVALSEPPSSGAAWTLELYAVLESQPSLVGRVTTRAPSAGDPPSRVVAWACCPGASGWEVTASSPGAGNVAHLSLGTGATGPAIVGVVLAVH